MRFQSKILEPAKKLKFKTISRVIKKLANDYVQYHKFLSPGCINEGHCNIFAGYVKEIFPKVKLVFDGKIDEEPDWFDHCCVYYNGKYYDAECPQGVQDWRDLPFYESRI